MGTRIGCTWTKTNDDGSLKTTGELSSPAGINVPAGQKIPIMLVRNEKHVEGDRLPQYYVETWTPTEQQ